MTYKITKMKMQVRRQIGQKAARDLLAALKEISNMKSGPGMSGFASRDGDTAQQVARAAIAKVEGM